MPRFRELSAARYDALEVLLDKPQEQLDSELAARVDRMVGHGFLDEVRVLEQAGLRSGTTARKALGYQQMLRVLDGELALPDAVAETVAATRRFVRRQRSWFARNSRAVRMDSGKGTAALLGPILAAARGSGA